MGFPLQIVKIGVQIKPGKLGVCTCIRIHNKAIQNANALRVFPGMQIYNKIEDAQSTIEKRHEPEILPYALIFITETSVNGCLWPRSLL